MQCYTLFHFYDFDTTDGLRPPMTDIPETADEPGTSAAPEPFDRALRALVARAPLWYAVRIADRTP